MWALPAVCHLSKCVLPAAVRLIELHPYTGAVHCRDSGSHLCSHPAEPFSQCPSPGRDLDTSHSWHLHGFPKDSPAKHCCQLLTVMAGTVPTPAQLSQWDLVRQYQSWAGLQSNLGSANPGKIVAQPALVDIREPHAPGGELKQGRSCCKDDIFPCSE